MQKADYRSITGLQLYRLGKGVSMQVVGKATHIPAAEVSYLEAGRLIPSDLQKERLSAYFGVPIDTLMKRFDLDELLQGK